MACAACLMRFSVHLPTLLSKSWAERTHVCKRKSQNREGAKGAVVEGESRKEERVGLQETLFVTLGCSNFRRDLLQPMLHPVLSKIRGAAPLNHSGLSQIIRPDREAAEASPSGSEDSIGHGGSNRRNAGFADTAGPLVVVDDMHFDDERGFVHAQDFVVVEI